MTAEAFAAGFASLHDPWLGAISHDLAGVAPALKNHLWQSTLFALAAGLLAVALRRNQARTRYWLWLAASVKFLVPFSLLISLGGHLARPRAVAPAPAAVYFAMEDFSQPFVQMPATVSVPAQQSAEPRELVPIALAAVWFAGFAAVVAVWFVYWRRVAGVLRGATPLREGRELGMLRRMEAAAGLRRQIRLLASASSLGPGIYGIARPVLIWPAAISERLDDAHLESVLAHEVCHVSRRDNLTAAIHMVVEAVFWFHPLVWWLGARLEAERERACDEFVLEASPSLAAQPRIYAESIVKICEFYVESPLPCFSGVTGAELKKRLARILERRRTLRLSPGKKLLLLASALIGIAIPIVLGAQASRTVAAEDWVSAAGGKQQFDVASVRPSESGQPKSNVPLGPGNVFSPSGGILRAENFTLLSYLDFAYKLTDYQHNALKEKSPEWVSTDLFNIDARTESREVTKDQLRLMVRALLAERFKLAVHYEARRVPVYALVQARGGQLGPKLRVHPADLACPDTLTVDLKSEPQTSRGDFPAVCGGILGLRASAQDRYGFGAANVPMSLIASSLSSWGNLGRPVVDRTGLRGAYDFVLDYTPEPRPKYATVDSGGPSFQEALQLQLGLKLEAAKAPVEFVVLDHVERPPAQEKAGAAPPVSAAPMAASSARASTATLKSVAFVQEKPAEPHAQKTLPPSFEVATIRAGDPNARSSGLNQGRDGIQLVSMPLNFLLQFAYNLNGGSNDQMVDAPAWVNSVLFSISAKEDEELAAKISKMPSAERIATLRAMTQALLADRFQLRVHHETRMLPVLALTVAKGGPKLTLATPLNANDSTARSNSDSWRGLHNPGRGQTEGRDIPIKLLADNLSRQPEIGGRLVIDETGLQGQYSFKLNWTPDRGSTHSADGEGSGPSLFTALQEQLGLRLESKKAPVDCIVIDHIQRPSEN